MKLPFDFVDSIARPEAVTARRFHWETAVHHFAPVTMRWALGLTLLSAVADRFGFWGAPGGADSVSWGDWPHFVAYTAKVNDFLPTALASTLAVVATAVEILLGVFLLLGLFPRPTAWASAALFAAFAAAMTLSFGIKAPLNYSVWVDAAAAYLLASGFPVRRPTARSREPHHYENNPLSPALQRFLRGSRVAR